MNMKNIVTRVKGKQPTESTKLIGPQEAHAHAQPEEKLKLCYDRDCPFTMTCARYDADGAGDWRGDRHGLMCLDYVNNNRRYEDR